MLFSIYPTDDPATREAVLAQALAQPATLQADGTAERMLFTSLHLVDVGELAAFGDVLRDLHDAHGVTFCADVSASTVRFISAGAEGWAWASRRGIRMLRLDDGFDPAEIRRLVDVAGCRVAVNASTVDAAFLDDLGGVPVAGWHNFYPRPDTGLTEAYAVSQSRMFVERGLAVFAFVPGEREFRAPLHLGLPTLEGQRHRNAWRTSVQWRRLVPEAILVCAEGTIAHDHAAWAADLDGSGVVTVPVVGLDPAASALLGGHWRLRVEDAAASFRLDGSRGVISPSRILNAHVRERGSVQADLDAYGRYRGEVHLMRESRPLDGGQARIGDVAAPYRDLVDDLRPGDTVRFVEFRP